MNRESHTFTSAASSPTVSDKELRRGKQIELHLYPVFLLFHII
jgi:hypothetical protein